MMKKTALAALIALSAIPLCAEPPNIGMLQAYAAKALTKCPDGKITLQPINEPGPAGFIAFELTETSSDPTCGRHTILLFSPSSNQILTGSVIALPPDNRTAEARIADTASGILKQTLTATVNAFPLPDALRAVSMTRQTQWGPFSYHGFLDASGRFLVVGSRGNLYIDPSTTLLESIGIENAVRRGNPSSKVKIIEISDFECPTCGRAHKEVEPLIEKNLSKVDYYRLDLPLFEHHEWALPAAMGARAIQRVAPAKYWSYVNFVFANQEAIGKAGSFDKTLQNFCEDNDIDWARVEKIYRSQPDRTALLEQVSRAFDVGVNSTPTYIINGQMIGYGPSGTFSMSAIRNALGVPEPPPKKLAKKPEEKKPAKNQR